MVHVEFYKNKKNLIVAFKSPTHNTRLFFSKTMSVFTFFLIQNPSLFFFFTVLPSNSISDPAAHHSHTLRNIQLKIMDFPLRLIPPLVGRLVLISYYAFFLFPCYGFSNPVSEHLISAFGNLAYINI